MLFIILQRYGEISIHQIEAGWYKLYGMNITIIKVVRYTLFSILYLCTNCMVIINGRDDGTHEFQENNQISIVSVSTSLLY